MIKAVQMWSLRQAIDEKGLDEVLAIVKRAGFDAVEVVAGSSYGLTNEQLKAKFDAAGLTVTGMHVSVDSLVEEKAIKAKADALGTRDLIVAWSHATKDDLDKIVGALPHYNGYRVGYHNHDHEFAPEHAEFLSGLLASPVLLEPDVFWVTVAGLRTAEFLDAHADRIMTVHLKELATGGKTEHNPVLGQGVAGITDALRFAQARALPYVVLEIEHIGMGIEEYLTACADYINAELRIKG